MEGRVLFFEGDRALVSMCGENKPCQIRGKIKATKDGIMVGDVAKISEDGLVIEQIKERKNSLVRPKVANVNQIIICVSSEPPADLMLADKLIIASIKNNIEPIICITKTDIVGDKFEAEIKAQYKAIKVKTISVSAKTHDGLDNLLKLLKNKTSALAGQSGVGKSSLINAILGETIKTQELVKNSIRGKNTTTASFLYSLDKNTFLIDTPGFCTLDLEIKKAEEILALYPDIYDFARFCRYKSCNHIDKNADECGVTKALEEGKINKARLERFYKYYKTASGKRTIYNKGKKGKKNV